MNRLDRPDNIRPSDEALDQLHRSGWSIGDVASMMGQGGANAWHQAPRAT